MCFVFISLWNCSLFTNTVMILSFRTDRSGQTVQTQIRLLGTLLFCKAILFKFSGDYSKFSGVWNFRIFTVVNSQSQEKTFQYPIHLTYRYNLWSFLKGLSRLGLKLLNLLVCDNKKIFFPALQRKCRVASNLEKSGKLEIFFKVSEM